MFQKPAFGANTSGFGGFGAAAAQTGTAHVTYSPLVGTDVVVKSGASQSINIKHHCITCMKEYESKSLEELRLEDYTAGRKGSSSGFWFGINRSKQTENKPLFGAQTSTFGAPATSAAPSVFGGGTTLGTSGGFGQPNSSFSFGGGAPANTNTSGLFGAQPFRQTSTAGGFGAAAAQTGTAHVKYSPLVGTDVVVKSGASQSINIKHHCITCMKEYESKSLEELRLEDYTAGRKGSSSGFWFGINRSKQTENKPLFGAQTSTFGAPATSAAPSVFGGGTTLGTSGGFGQPNSSFSFGGGAPANTNTSGLFGAQPFGAQPFGAQPFRAQPFRQTSTAGTAASTKASNSDSNFSPIFLFGSKLKETEEKSPSTGLFCMPQTEEKSPSTDLFCIPQTEEKSPSTGLFCMPLTEEKSPSTEFRSIRNGWSLSRAPLVRKR